MLKVKRNKGDREVSLSYFLASRSDLELVFHKVEARHGNRLPGRGVDVDENSVDPEIFLGHLVSSRTSGAKTIDDAVDFSSNNTIESAGHSDVALERGAAG